MSDSAFRYKLDKISIGEVGLRLIKRHEGFEPYFYLDSAGVPTIGYGTTIGALPEDPQEPIKKSTAERYLMQHLTDKVEPSLRLLLNVPLTRNEFSALCSLTYNIGVRAFRESILRSVLNDRKYDRAADEFGEWIWYTDPDTGRKMRSAGLQRRREAERLLFVNHPDGAVEIEPLTTRGLRPIALPLDERETNDITRDLA